MIKLKIWLYNWLAKNLGKLGREGDTELAHVNTWEANLLKAHGGSGSINPTTGLREYKGGGGGQTQTTTQNIDPEILPYITYGLDEAKTLYGADSPEYYPDATYVPASANTTEALGLAGDRARTGSPLIPAAQTQALSTIQGDRLSAGNPYFSAMMTSAARPAVTEFNKAIRDIGSRTAASGRYGSGAMGEMESQASENLANSLTNRAAELAYSNFGAERARQDAAIAQAPQMAAADYSDIQQLMNVGQQQEDYSRQELQSDIGRFEFEQNKPYTKLQSYLSAAYGAPAPMNSTTQSSGGGGK
tara:strand:- start:5091 stop:5999 length:909 start_codon:yes stop_codon:yes gene_type:complete